jgi:hypothetical protein
MNEPTRGRAAPRLSCTSCGHARAIHCFDADGKPTRIIDNLYQRGSISCDATSWTGRYNQDLAGYCGCEGYVGPEPEPAS